MTIMMCIDLPVIFFFFDEFHPYFKVEGIKLRQQESVATLHASTPSFLPKVAATQCGSLP